MKGLITMTEIVDALGVPEFFCEALGRIEQIGPNRRLVFVVTQPSRSGEPERIAAVKIILPAEACAALAQVLLNDGPQAAAFASMPMNLAN